MLLGDFIKTVLEDTSINLTNYFISVSHLLFFQSLVAPTSNQTNTPKSEARRGILGMFPRIVSSISKLWGAVQLCEKQRDTEQRPKDPPKWSMGSPKVATF